MPNQLPYLPGNVYADPTITRYHKTQLLGLKDGTITGKKSISQLTSILLIFKLARYINGGRV